MNEVWIAGTAGTLVTVVSSTIAARRQWRSRLGPFVESLNKALIVLNGRDAISLPESPSTELAPPIKGALERLNDIEQGQSALVMQLGGVQRTVTALSSSHGALLEKVLHIEAEVTPNGGGSIKDAVGRIEAQLNNAESQNSDSRSTL